MIIDGIKWVPFKEKAIVDVADSKFIITDSASVLGVTRLEERKDGLKVMNVKDKKTIDVPLALSFPTLSWDSYWDIETELKCLSEEDAIQTIILGEETLISFDYYKKAKKILKLLGTDVKGFFYRKNESYPVLVCAFSNLGVVIAPRVKD